jgi:hypothetical protein
MAAPLPQKLPNQNEKGQQDRFIVSSITPSVLPPMLNLLSVDHHCHPT